MKKCLLFLTTVTCTLLAQIQVGLALNSDKQELGKRLFFDPRLSKTATVSCNSCHNVMSGGDDARSTSVGIKGQIGGRNAPTVWNAALHSVQFWDGRAKDLKEQAKGPITNPIEMGMESHDAVVARLKTIPGYVTEFAKVYKGSDPLTIDNVADAIAAFEESLVVRNSKYDRFKKGDQGALSGEEKKGQQLFTSVGCVACHSGENFAGPISQKGQGFFMKFPTFPDSTIENKYKFSSDLGRYNVTKNENDKFMFRVPTLRNIALTAPYFHNGAVNDLGEAVRIMAKTQLNRELNNDEVKALVSFLGALTDTLPTITSPRLPPTMGTATFE